MIPFALDAIINGHYLGILHILGEDSSDLEELTYSSEQHYYFGLGKPR